jgi:hypothetical protein
MLGVSTTTTSPTASDASASGGPSQHDPIGTIATFTVYENQRWFMFKGWSDTLLPTDRPHYSDKRGKLSFNLDKYALPPLYAWVTSWEVDVDAEATDAEGWRYAVDFPANYQKNKSPLTMVRRRRWVRKAERRSANTWTPNADSPDDYVNVGRNGSMASMAASGASMASALSSVMPPPPPTYHGKAQESPSDARDDRVPARPPAPIAPPAPLDFDAPIPVQEVEPVAVPPQDRHFEDLLHRFAHD